MKIVIGSDHVGYDYKEEIKEYLADKNIQVIDVGTFGKERCDYPVSSYKAAKKIVEGEADAGILICGTGVGISLAANKVKGIRACVCSEPYTAQLSKKHNNTNVLAFGARVVGIELAKMIIDAWLEAEYEGGRHAKRVQMLSEIENSGSLTEL